MKKLLCSVSFPLISVHCIHISSCCRPTRNKNIDAQDKLTIYFHAVLSKDFKFDPDKDQIFIRAGECIGSWGSNIVELNVTRYSHK